ncbi:MAG: lysophospholipid acyltransferase family protein [Rhodothermales bacterium]
MIRRIWRLLRVLVVTVVHTAYSSLAARLRPAAQRPAFRAYRQQIGSRALCRALGVRVSMRGTLPPEKTVLMVCNHLGILDPLVLSSQLSVSFAGKAEMGRWPLIGWVCRTMGMLPVHRERPTRTSMFVRQVQEKLHAGVPVLVFPEGTTSRGDGVQPFKTGAFQAVAERDDEAVLPLYLNVLAVEEEPAALGRRYEVTWADNTQTFLEHCWHLLGLKSVEMEVCIGKPITTARRDRKELARLTHREVRKLGEQSFGEPGR